MGDVAQIQMPEREPEPEEIRVAGTTQLSIFDLGGKKAASATIRLVGGKVALMEGQAYRKGDAIHFEGTAVVNEVGQKDQHDPKTGLVVSAEQRHGARIVDLVVSAS